MLLISVSFGLFEIGMYSSSEIEFNYSGLIGGNLANFFVSFFGMIGSSIILLTSWLVLVRGYFSWSFYRPFDSLTNFIKKRQEDRKLVSVEQASEKEKRRHTLDLMQKIEEKQEEDVIIKENDTETTEDDLIGSGEIDATPEPLEKPSEEIFNATGSTSGFSSAPVSEDSFYDETKNIDDIKDMNVEEESQKILETTEPSEPNDKNIEVGEVVTEDEVNIDELEARKAPKRKYQLPSSDLLEIPVKVQDGMSKDCLLYTSDAADE